MKQHKAMIVALIVILSLIHI
ncbi:hypothetical protein, partial [Escherichia coli]